MAKIVYTSVDHIDEIESAKWIDGDNDSYDVTKRIAKRQPQDIHLIGRQDKYGRVQLCYAANRDGDFYAVNEGHLMLAKFFEKKYTEYKSSGTSRKGSDGIDVLRPFFEEIDDEHATNMAQRLIALECGINVKKELHGELHYAILQVSAALNALGVGCGDWTFEPMFNSFKKI